MDTVTYPDVKTVEFVRDHMIPLRVNVRENHDLAMKFQIQYTPTIVTVDGDGNELHRTVGFYPPKEFVPMMMLSIGKAYFDASRYDKALAILTKLVERYPASQSASSAKSLKEISEKKLK